MFTERHVLGGCSFVLFCGSSYVAVLLLLHFHVGLKRCFAGACTVGPCFFLISSPGAYENVVIVVCFFGVGPYGVAKTPRQHIFRGALEPHFFQPGHSTLLNNDAHFVFVFFLFFPSPKSATCRALPNVGASECVVQHALTVGGYFSAALS